MSLFGKLSSDAGEEGGDFLGSGGLLDTDVYTGKIKVMYAQKSTSSDSMGVTVILDLDNNGRPFEYRETIYVTNRDGENTYPDKKDPTKKHLLPGFVTVNHIALVTTGKELSEIDTPEKVISIYDFEQKKEVPKNVPVMLEMIGQEVTVAIVRQIRDKQAKNSAGVYVNMGETREENTIDKVFHTESMRTVTEIREQLEEGAFLTKWLEKNKGKTRNRSEGSKGGAKEGAPGAAGATAQAKPKSSLFGSK